MCVQALGKPRCRCENIIKMDHTETRCEGMTWSELAQEKVQ
jgi:hypothetical protein